MKSSPRAELVLAGLALACTVLRAPKSHAESVNAATLYAIGTSNGVAACASCHGAGGQGNREAAFPRLTGLGAAYALEQLEAFAGGTRKSPVMQPLASALIPAQRAALADYISTLWTESKAGVADLDAVPSAPAQTGAWLATRGRWKDDVPACAQCHGVTGEGVPPHFPPLAGQSAAYLAGQLRAWQHGDRPPGPLGLMAAVAKKLSDSDITAVADYYANSPGTRTTGRARTGAQP